MYFHKLTAPALHRVHCAAFGGLDRRYGARAGTAREMENLDGGAYPALQTRPRRGVVASLTSGGGMTGKEALVWVEGGTVYVAGYPTSLTVTAGEKQFVSLGAYLVIFPDKKWLNMRNLSEFGSLEHSVTTTGPLRKTLCRTDGTAYGDYTASAAAPREAEGALWLDTAEHPAVLRRFSQGSWVEVEGVCVKLQWGNLGEGFSAGDGVEISGCLEEHLNGLHILESVTQGAIVVAGTVDAEGEQRESVTVARTVPDMDFVVECAGRLWGCKYGVVADRAVNEIYGSALGDMRNWHRFAGLSTDSYAASRGSDGVFTGAAVYGGTALFFKENCVERLYPASGGNHQIVTSQCPGVAAGSGKSLCSVEGTLYYVGRHGVYAYAGALPEKVSAPLEGLELTGGVGGTLEGRYYLSARAGEGHHLLVLDTRRDLWHRQDGLAVTDFAAWDGELYALTADGRVLSLHGRGGTAEAGELAWLWETGELGVEAVERKYPMRLSLALELARGALVHAALSYDGGLTWEPGGTVEGRDRLHAVTLHLRPRRCAHLRLRLWGTGEMTLRAVHAVYEKGSDEA